MKVLLASLVAIVVAPMLPGVTHVFAAETGKAEFSGPTGIASCDSHVWVTNVTGNTVTELRAIDGREIQVFGGAQSSFSDPMSVATNGVDLWVTNLVGDSVTELNCATGSTVRVLDSGDLNSPAAVAIGDAKVWLTNESHENDSRGNQIPDSSSVTIFNSRTGSLVKNIDGNPANGLNGSSGVAVSGKTVWVTNALGNSVTEFDATTGREIRDIGNGEGQFKWPMAVATTTANVWVANLYGNSLTEINESTGSVTRVVVKDELDGPDALFVLGNHIWVTNLFGNSVTELNSRSGALIRVIRSNAFSAPSGITSAGSTIWVTNQWNNSVAELEASNGQVLRVVR